MMRIATKLTIDKASKQDVEEMMEPFSPSSKVYYRAFQCHILVVIGFNCPINFDTFRQKIPLALNHPRFSSVMVEGVENKEDLKWVQIPQKNIDNHIVIPSINSTAYNNRLAADKFVEDYLNNLTQSPLDISKVPWEIHLLNMKTSEAESIVIFRIHHALGDGISITSHLLTWTRQVSNPNALPTIATMKKKDKAEKLVRDDRYYFKYCWKMPWRFMLGVWWWTQVLCNTIIDVLMLLATTFFFKDSDILNIAKREIANTKERRIVYKTVSLDDMKLIKNAMNATINDVAVGIIEAGFSRYLSRRFGNGCSKKEEMNSINNMLKKIRMTMAIAVNQRSLIGIQGLEDIKKKDTKLGMGNKVGFVIAPLSIKLRDDPLEYVRSAKATVDRKKRSLGAKANLKICELLLKIFGTKFAGWFTAKLFNHTSIFISSVPGPVEETSLFGHTINFIAPTAYGFPSPIIIHLQSCVNKMTMVVSVRDDVMIDPHQLCDAIVESLFLIRGAVIKVKTS